VNKGWTDEELTAAVVAYQKFLAPIEIGISKRGVYRELASRFGRTPKAFEDRLQNISHVLGEMGQEIAPGLLPAANVGPDVRKRLQKIIEQQLQNENSIVSPQSHQVAQLPAMRRWLIEVARNEGMVSYGDMISEFEIDRFSLRHALSRLGHQSRQLREPIITALVVLKGTRRCSNGLQDEFGVNDDEAERRRLYKYWRHPRKNDEFASSSLKHHEVKPKNRRFARVEVRPDQRAFRDAVFAAYGGACVISDCTIEPALDAAHKIGRGWRLGYNRAEDGYLLRKDLHALYDATLLKISLDGVVTFDESVLSHYREFEGARIKAQRHD
jgi:hypothetical protein